MITTIFMHLGTFQGASKNTRVLCQKKQQKHDGIIQLLSDSYSAKMYVTD